MIFAAIDPGSVHAAIAVYHDGEPVFVDDIRTVNGMLDSAMFAHALRDMKVERIVVESVHAMPKQGVSSTFKFGMGVGIIHGVAGALLLPMTSGHANPVEILPRPQRGEGSFARPRDTEVAPARQAAGAQEGRRPGRSPPDRRLVLRQMYNPQNDGPHHMNAPLPRHWRALVERPHDQFKPIHSSVVAVTMEMYGLDEAKARAFLQEDHDRSRYFVNDIYQVQVQPCGADDRMLHINIRRRDGAMFKDWRHFQQIKNEIAGPEREAVEIYPAESRKVDTSNKWHLWVLPEGVKLDLGWGAGGT